MGVRVAARIRPQQQNELEKDIILSTANSEDTSDQPTIVKIPNPKNESEAFTFQFTSVYDSSTTQQQIFDNEVSPTVKHLFNGFDVTIFAYGSTGTGKTHTMRGGKSLADRGVIPRLLSAIYRRARKIEKDSGGNSKVDLSLSYYEIYNDKVFDLFEAPEKRTLAGLPLRDNGGKTVVVGLTERPCGSLKEFEKLYDQANNNRSTSATKLNAVSSRSHAILGIKLTVTSGDEIRISTASAIDLAGSEDNRRTDNGKERMVESASINKSLFVLAKCVEAISSSSTRIPYRESKMTRILSLGQNNGLTVMILNLAPTRPYHLDTLSSLNFANRTKKIEVREVENEPIFKGCSRAVPTFSGKTIDRQPLRPLANTVHNSTLNAVKTAYKPGNKLGKAFSVYSDRNRHSNSANPSTGVENFNRSSPRKRPSDSFPSATRHVKRRSPNRNYGRTLPPISKETIEEIIERKVDDILTARALDQSSIAPQPEISEELQKRLDLLEQRVDGQDQQGLNFLLMAKQHAVRGEYASALRMYTMAKDYFPDNKTLDRKIEKLQGKIQRKPNDSRCVKGDSDTLHRDSELTEPSISQPKRRAQHSDNVDEDYREDIDNRSCGSDTEPERKAKVKRKPPKTTCNSTATGDSDGLQTPRTTRLLEIINGRNVTEIRLLKGVGVKKAEAIIDALSGNEEDGDEGEQVIYSLEQLGRLRGVSSKTVEAMRSGLS
ncbi:hypothetical protein ACLMJK_000195 [Lecanora helva]